MTKTIKTWYAELREKGERQLLIDAVVKGDRNSCDQALRLASRYPDAAMPAIAAGLKTTKDGAIRDLLVCAAAQIPNDSALPLFLTKVKQGETAAGRLLAAKALHNRSRQEGVEAMIAEWHGNRPIQPASSSQRKEVSEGPEAGLSEVADFLADSGKVEAISALEGNLGKRLWISDGTWCHVAMLAGSSRARWARSAEGRSSRRRAPARFCIR